MREAGREGGGNLEGEQGGLIRRERERRSHNVYSYCRCVIVSIVIIVGNPSMHVCIVDVASSPGHSQLSMLHAEKLPVFQRATLKSLSWTSCETDTSPPVKN